MQYNDSAVESNIVASTQHLRFPLHQTALIHFTSSISPTPFRGSRLVRIVCKEKRIVGGMPAQRNIGVEELQQYFGLPAKEVAKSLGICLTSLKKVCRNNEIHRWPDRKVTIFYEIFTNRYRRPPHFISIFVNEASEPVGARIAACRRAHWLASYPQFH